MLCKLCYACLSDVRMLLFVSRSPVRLNYCLLFVCVKFVASTDRLLMWIDLYSLVDHFTIVPTFVGLHFDSSWIGLYSSVQCFKKIPLCNSSISVLNIDRFSKTSFTDTLNRQFATKLALKIQSYLKRVATPPCKIQFF